MKIYVYDIDEIKTRNFKRECGVYGIKDLTTGEVYIGSSINIYQRLLQHKHHLLRGNHDNSFLQKAFTAGDEIKFGVIEYCKKEDRLKKELYYINLEVSCFNIKGVLDQTKGKPMKPVSLETRNKLSEVKKGKSPSNLKTIQANKRIAINYYIYDKLIKKFNSCSEAASFFKMKPNNFHQYINTSYNSKKFPKGYRLEYD